MFVILLASENTVSRGSHSPQYSACLCECVQVCFCMCARDLVPLRNSYWFPVVVLLFSACFSYTEIQYKPLVGMRTIRGKKKPHTWKVWVAFDNDFWVWFLLCAPLTRKIFTVHYMISETQPWSTHCTYNVWGCNRRQGQRDRFQTNSYIKFSCVSINILLPKWFHIIRDNGMLCLPQSSDQMFPLQGFTGRACSYVRRVCSEVQLFLLVGEWPATECELRQILVTPGVMTPSNKAFAAWFPALGGV